MEKSHELRSWFCAGQNVLHDFCCADYYSPQIFMTLIEKGADPFAKDKNGETPVSLVFKISAKTEKKSRLWRQKSNSWQRYGDI